MEAKTDGVLVTSVSGRNIPAEGLLLATGCRPRTAGLHLETAGVGTDDRGFVQVDTAQRTSNPRVYATGDVTRGPQFVYVAAAQGRFAGRNAVAGREGGVDYTGMPATNVLKAGLTADDLVDTWAPT